MRFLASHPFGLGFFAVDFIAGEDVAGALPCAAADEFEGYGRATCEEWCAFACYQRENDEVQFVYEIMYEQVVPEHAAE